MNCENAFPWATVDFDVGEVIAVRESRGRSCFEAFSSRMKVGKKWTGRFPRMFEDGGDWCPWVFKQILFNRWHAMT